MPYKRNAELPPAAKKLPKAAQSVFRKAFDAALKQYGDDDKAFAVAWSAVKKAGYRKDKDGNWIHVEGAAYVEVNASSVTFQDAPADRPNWHPFKGILCVLDEPSVAAPGGTGGNRVILTKELAEKILPTLLGQAIDYTPNLKEHDKQMKVGVITGASIVDNQIHVEGGLYVDDFPELLPRIKAHITEMGMSFELDAAFEKTDQPNIVKITHSPGFTGAAILLQKAAAYGTKTRLAASTARKENRMELKELKEALGGLLVEFKGELMTEIDSKLSKVAAAKKKDAKEALKDDVNEGEEMAMKAKKLHADSMEAMKGLKKAHDDGDADDYSEAHDEAMKAHKDLGSHLKAMHEHLKGIDVENALKDGKDEDDKKKVAGAAAKNDEVPAWAKELKDDLASVKKIQAGNSVNNDPGRKTLDGETLQAVSKMLASAGAKGLDVKEGEKLTAIEAAAKVNAALDAAGITDPLVRMQAKMKIPG